MARVRAISSLLLVLPAIAIVMTAESAHQTVPEPAVDENSRFDGIWRGTIEGFHAPGLFEERTWDNTLEFRIAGDQVEVMILKNGEWEPVKPIRFKIDSHLSNAVIYATHSRENRWVSTWSFTVTLRSEDLMRVYWYRVVDNPVLPDSHNQRSYAFGGFGEMERISADTPLLPEQEKR